MFGAGINLGVDAQPRRRTVRNNPVTALKAFNAKCSNRIYPPIPIAFAPATWTELRNSSSNPSPSSESTNAA